MEDRPIRPSMKTVRAAYFLALLVFGAGVWAYYRYAADEPAWLMAKIQDVTVSQTPGQRLLGVGDLKLESAGESGSMGIRNVDRPRDLADAILAGANKLLRARGAGLA